MDAELLEIQNFLAQYPPFSELPEEILVKVTSSVEISYYRQDTPIIHFGDQIHDSISFEVAKLKSIVVRANSIIALMKGMCLDKWGC